jgi:hypothetical protein
MYYKRYELQWRLTLFFTASIIAGAFGGASLLPLYMITLLTISSYWPLQSPKWTG